MRLLYSARASVPFGCVRRPGTRSVWENPHQADVPTQEKLSAQDAWFPRAHGDTRRKAGAQGAPSQRPEALDACEYRVNRRHRLRGRGRFAAVRRAGVESRHGLVRVRVLPNGLGVFRAGLAVFGARTAVERNRARRVVRAALAPMAEGIAGLDAVVSVPARAGGVAPAMLGRDLASALNEAAQRSAAR
jgi:ribonuclease P protein component